MPQRCKLQLNHSVPSSAWANRRIPQVNPSIWSRSGLLIFLTGLIEQRREWTSREANSICSCRGPFRPAEKRAAGGALTFYLINLLRSSPKEGGSFVPVILIGRTVPAPFRVNSGSTAFSKSDLIPVVICDNLASSRKVPWKSRFSLISP